MGPKPSCQESVKLREQVAEEDKTMRKLKQKIEVLEEHSVPISSMAEVLEVKEEALESLVRCPPSPASSCSAMSTTSDAALDSQILKFEHVFEFLVNDAGHAELTFVLMKKRKSSKQVDKCIVPISDILSAHQRTLTT